VPPDAPPLVAARTAGVEVRSEIDVALRGLAGVPYIGITGTNGKTTVTALIAHLLRAMGRETVEAGNIGMPLSEVALGEQRPQWISIELSSYQLHDSPSVAPRIAVLTNLAPDHLDRYASLEEYYGDKDLLFRNATAESVRVVNADDAEVMRRTAQVPGVARRFSLNAPGSDGSSPGAAAGAPPLGPADAWFDTATDCLVVGGTPLLERALFPLLGAHNIANALAAALAVWHALPEEQNAVGRAKLAGGLRSFTPIPHRLEPVGERDGVLWVNDSKATNIGAARVALEAMTRPTVLLLGGRHKGEPYTNLLAAMRPHVKLVLAYGESAPLVETDLKGHVPVERLGSSFEQVIARARAAAERGDVVLLAPACSSFDMFRNYEERGTLFRQLALQTAE
jgi:UDP-N-acetylmuramoylalanine--D-glutamate ligase